MITLFRLLKRLFAPRPVNYYAYLQSPEWKARARKTKIRAGMRCHDCGIPGNFHMLQAHHLNYDRLGHERQSDLMCLCAECHKARS